MAAPTPVGTPGAAVFTAGNVPTSVNLVPTCGTGYAVGDVLLCFTACTKPTANVLTPSGWTKLLEVVANGKIALFGKVAASTSEAAPTVGWNTMTSGTSGTPAGARIQAFTNLTLDIDVLGTVENATDSTLAASGNPMTIATAEDLVLCLAIRLDDLGTWSAPAGMAMINSNLTTSGLDMCFAWAYGSGPAVGSFAPDNFGLTGAINQSSSGVAIALKGVAPALPDYESSLDSFDRANGKISDGVGAALWQSVGLSGSAAVVDIRDNAITGNTGSPQSASKFRLAQDFDLLLDCVVPPASSIPRLSLHFCLSEEGTAGWDGYVFRWLSSRMDIDNYVNGSFVSTLATFSTSPPVAGDTIWIEKRSTTIKVYKRPSGGAFSLLMTLVDSLYNREGTIAVAVGTETTPRWDNLRGGPTTAPRHYSSLSLPITFGSTVKGIVRKPSPYADAVLADGAYGYWRMDEETALPQDSAPNANHFIQESGTTVGNVSGLLPNEPTSKARSFLSSYVRASGYFPNERYEFNTFSIEFWIKRNAGGPITIITQYNGGFEVNLRDDGLLMLLKSYTGGIANAVNHRITDTNAHHVVITRAGIGGQVIFYLDGVAEVGGAVNLNLDTAAGVANNGLFLGSQAGTGPLNGMLDEVAIYPVVLTPAQVANHYFIATHIATTMYGALAFPMSFGKDVKGQKKTFGQVARPITFSKDVKGQKKTFGQVIFPTTFGKDVVGRRTTFSKIVFPIDFTSFTDGTVKGRVFGSLSLPIIFGKDVKGIKSGSKFFSSLSLPITFGKDVRGRRQVFGQVALPIVFSKDVQGRRKTFGQVSLPLIFSEQVVGRRWVYGKVAQPFTFGATIQGRRQTFSQLAFPVSFAVDVKSGRVGVKGKIVFPIMFVSDITGRKTYGSIVLNNAQMVYLGIDPVEAAYTDNQKVWP